VSFEVFKKIFIFFVIVFVSVFILISYSKDLVSFVKSQTLRIYAVNVDILPIVETVEGNTIFAAVQVNSPSDGRIAYVVDNGMFVDKGTLLARIIGKDYSTDVLSPSQGIFLWESLSTYSDSLDTLVNSNPNFTFKDINQGSNAKANETIGSVVCGNSFAVKIHVNNGDSLPQSIPIALNGSLNVINANVVKSDGKEAFLRLDSFFKELYDKKQFDIVLKMIRGFEVDKKDIVKRKGVYGIYVVNGDRVKFVEVELYNAPNKIYVSIKDPNFASFNTFLVVKSTLFVKEGDLVGSF
jgi:hypothetical protein